MSGPIDGAGKNKRPVPQKAYVVKPAKARKGFSGLTGCVTEPRSAVIDGGVPANKVVGKFNVALAGSARGRYVEISKEVKPKFPQVPTGSKLFIVLKTNNRDACASYPEGKAIPVGKQASVDGKPVFYTGKNSGDDVYVASGLKLAEEKTSADGATKVTQTYYTDKNGNKVIGYQIQKNYTLPTSQNIMANNNWKPVCKGTTEEACAVDDIGKIKDGAKPKLCTTENSCDPNSLTGAKIGFQVLPTGDANASSSNVFGLQQVFPSNKDKICTSKPFKYYVVDNKKQEIPAPTDNAKLVVCGEFPVCDVKNVLDGGAGSVMEAGAVSEAGAVPTEAGVTSTKGFPVSIAISFLDKFGKVINKGSYSLLSSSIKVEVPTNGVTVNANSVKIEAKIDTSNEQPGAIYGINLTGDLAYEVN